MEVVDRVEAQTPEAAVEVLVPHPSIPHAWYNPRSPFDYYTKDGLRNVARTNTERYGSGQRAWYTVCLDCGLPVVKTHYIQVHGSGPHTSISYLQTHLDLEDQKACDWIRALLYGAKT